MDPLQAEESKPNDIKKKGGKTQNYGINNNGIKTFKGSINDPSAIFNIMIQQFLQPKMYMNFPEGAAFKFSSEEII